MSFTKHVWLPICSQLSTRTAYRNTERPYINFFCFIDANFWNEVEGKRFVIRDDIPHVAVGYAGLSISKLKKDCLSITPQFVASVDTKKNWNFLTSNVFKTNTLLNDWKKNLIACNLISYQRCIFVYTFVESSILSLS